MHRLQLIDQSINILSIIYAKIYFPTYSNGLKEIGQHIGYRWSNSNASGISSLIWRQEWESSKSLEIKEDLIKYNSDDCLALKKVFETVNFLCKANNDATKAIDGDIVHTDLLKREYPQHFGKVDFELPELEIINRASYWDYQRDKIYVKSKKKYRWRSQKSIKSCKIPLSPNKVVKCCIPTYCPKCKATKIYKNAKRTKIVYDLKFSRTGIKRWIVSYFYHQYICWDCHFTFTFYDRDLIKNKFGLGFLAFVIYQIIDLKIPQNTVAENIKQLFKLPVRGGIISRQKEIAADFYKETYEFILNKIATGNLIHADETKANIQGKEAYVWVFTNMEEVAYVYAKTREADLLQELLKDFKGILVSDFYAAYDSIDCLQQKCLIHLMRDLERRHI